MKALTKKAVFFAIALSLTLIAAGTYSYFFLKMKGYAEQAIILNAKADDLEGRESRINTAVTTMKNESARITTLSSYFIKESEVVLFTQKIEAVGKDAGVELSIVSLDSGAGEKGATVLNFRVKAKGEFQNVVKFMGLMENFSAKFDWWTVRLEREDGSFGKIGEAEEEGNKERKFSQPSNPAWVAEVSMTALNYVKE